MVSVRRVGFAEDEEQRSENHATIALLFFREDPDGDGIFKPIVHTNSFQRDFFSRER